jgi:hypothetical protein
MPIVDSTSQSIAAHKLDSSADQAIGTAGYVSAYPVKDQNMFGWVLSVSYVSKAKSL